MTIHAETFGHAAGETPLVLLHGFGGIGSVWRDVASRLSPAQPILAPDLPGHGRSLGLPAGGAGRIAKAVLAELEERGHASFHLCGHSLGGAAAALMALRHPERVRSLTLLAPGGFGPDINGQALAHWRDARDAGNLRQALAPMVAPGFVFEEGLIAELAAARSLPGSHQALEAIFASMFAGEEGRQGVLPVADLGRLTCPVTVLWGTEDRILPFTQTEGLPPSLSVIRLDGAGHMLIEECPAAVADSLGRHLS